MEKNICNQCDYASSQAGNLRTHMKTHSGEKSKKFNQCDYASSYAHHLRRHLKTYSGEKSYIQMQPIWLCLFSCRRFEETFESASWTHEISKIVKLQMQIYIKTWGYQPVCYDVSMLNFSLALDKTLQCLHFHLHCLHLLCADQVVPQAFTYL